MPKQLSQNEVNARFLRLHNLEKMYDNQVKANIKLKKENKKLKQRVIELDAENKEFRSEINDLKLIVEELRTMIFKKKGGNKKSKIISDSSDNIKSKKKRTKESYRRNIPNEGDVSSIEIFDIDSGCSICNGNLTKLETHTRYVEDLILPIGNQFVLKKITKQIIHKGYCCHCRKWTFGKLVPSQHCLLGEGLKAFIIYGIVTLRLSYDQVKDFLVTMVDITISDGEIVHILKKASVKLLPEYDAMIERIRSQVGMHMDETPWNVQSGNENRYARVCVAPDGKERVYILGVNRGMGNAEFLKGESSAVGISDDYGAYRNLFKHHQLCRAHPIRKMRDLVNSKNLNKLQIKQCIVSYDGFKNIHKELVNYINNKDQKNIDKKGLLKRFDEVTQTFDNDPTKMIKIKESLIRNKEKYFTCIDFDGIPTTNNTAERVLRPLVIKRKLCFGSKTSDGARMMEVLYSIVFSLLAQSRKNFFERYLALH